MFKKRNKVKSEERTEENNTNNLPIEVKKEKFFWKIIDFSKKYFTLIINKIYCDMEFKFKEDSHWMTKIKIL